jgi:DNA-binding response OmpR family regulator
MLHALIYAEDADMVVRLSDVFRETDYAVQAVGNLREARSALLHDMPDLALVDYDIIHLLLVTVANGY